IRVPAPLARRPPPPFPTRRSSDLITGAGGAKRPDTLKVVAGYRDGWMGLGQIGFSWPDAYLKCETSANIIKGLMEQRGWKPDERSEEHTSELQSLRQLVCRLLLEK